MNSTGVGAPEVAVREPRPPATVVVAVGLAAAAALAAAAGSVPALARGLGGARLAFSLLWLGAACGAFAVSSVRRDRWPWGVLVPLSIVIAIGGLIVLTVGLARRSWDTVGIAGAVAFSGAIATVAYLRRPTRAWHGFACPGCGRFRWPLRSEPARSPCLRCGALGPASGVGRPLPRWALAALYAMWAAAFLAGNVPDWLAARAERARLSQSDANIRIVGWEGYWGALAALAEITDAPHVALGPGRCARGSIPGHEGRAFVLDGDLAERILAGSHLHFLESGVFLFRCERGAASGRRRDVLAIMPTQDPRVVIRRLGTGAPGRGVTPDEVVARVEALAAEVSFEVTEVGVDYVAGTFDSLPEDTRPLAERILAIAPALRTITDAETLAAELARDGALYLWWPDQAAQAPSPR